MMLELDICMWTLAISLFKDAAERGLGGRGHEPEIHSETLSLNK